MTLNARALGERINPFVLRISSRPSVDMHRLQMTETRNILNAWFTAQQKASQVRAEIDSLLYTLIQQNPDPFQRKALIKEKRLISRPNRTDDNQIPLSFAHPAVNAQLRALQIIEEKKVALLSELTGVYASELRTSLEGLRACWLNDEHLLAALQVASPVLWSEFQRNKFCLEGSTKTARHLRQSLYAYLMRSACKPTPFSRFCSITVGQWATVGCMLEHDPEWRIKVSTSLNHQVRDAIIGGLIRSSTSLADHFIHLNNTVALNGQTFTYLSTKGPFVRLKRTPALEALRMELLAGSREAVTLAQHVLDAPNQGTSAFLRLQSAGFIHITPPNGPGPEPVQRLETQVETLLHAPLSERPALLSTLTEEVHGIYRTMNLGRYGWTPPARNLLFEDAFTDDLHPRADLDAWLPIRRDLALLQRAWSLLDPSRPLQLQFNQWFIRHFGLSSQVPLLDVLSSWTTFADSPAFTTQVWTVPTDPALTTLTALLRGDPQGVIDVVELANHLEQFDPSLSAPSYAFYGQVAGKDAHEFVINAVQLGLGRVCRRAQWISGNQLPLATLARPVVDLCADWHANIASHRSDGVHRVALPGTHDQAATGLHDLSMRVDTPLQRPVITSKTLQADVWAIPLVMLGRQWLPPAFALLVDLTIGAPFDPMAPPQFNFTDLPTSSKRVTCGAVTVHRARWNLTAHDAHLLGQDDGIRAVLAREERRRELGLPSRVFARGNIMGRWTKPALIDFDVPLSLGELQKFTAADCPVQLEEAWPDPLHLPLQGHVRSGLGTHVTEWVIEVNDG